jgi:hypothetical protein
MALGIFGKVLFSGRGVTRPNSHTNRAFPQARLGRATDNRPTPSGAPPYWIVNGPALTARIVGFAVLVIRMRACVVAVVGHQP